MNQLKELHCIHNHSKALEAKPTALQQRCKEQEMCMVKWEQCTNEHKATLADVQAALENAEDCAAQLEKEQLKARAAKEQRATVHFFFPPSLVMLHWPNLSGGCYVRTTRASCVTRQMCRRLTLPSYSSMRFRLPSQLPLWHSCHPVQTHAQVQYI